LIQKVPAPAKAQGFFFHLPFEIFVDGDREGKLDFGSMGWTAWFKNFVLSETHLRLRHRHLFSVPYHIAKFQLHCGFLVESLRKQAETTFILTDELFVNFIRSQNIECADLL